MKKILSCILAAAMLVGMLTMGAVAEDGTDLALKFDDIPMTDGGGNEGMANLVDTSLINASGFTLAMDFVYGRSCICKHPTDATMKHTSKFAFNVGSSEGTFKYIGYSADKEAFFLATGASAPMYGEGADGLTYLATSDTLNEKGEVTEKGIVLQPGVSYHVAYEFIGDTGIVIYVDGVEVLSFDLYDDMDYPSYFAYSGLMMFPTHMTCFVDNFAIYTAGTYDPVTGEGADDYSFISTFDDGKMVTSTQTDENGNETTATLAHIPSWQITTEAYSVVDAGYDVYAQPIHLPAEEEANIVFASNVDPFSSSRDFEVPLTIKNNTGLNSLELDLVQDAFITVKSVTAADGLTATLGETDANGITKLTITGTEYTSEALATITYTLSASAKQDFDYRYGAKVDTVKIDGTEAVEAAVITGGISNVYNYTVGDPNGDGEFNTRDVTVILKIVAKWDLPNVFNESGDVNGDGRTNSMDASYYLRWLAKWTKDYTINGITWY